MWRVRQILEGPVDISITVLQPITEHQISETFLCGENVINDRWVRCSAISVGSEIDGCFTLDFHGISIGGGVYHCGLGWRRDVLGLVPPKITLPLRAIVRRSTMPGVSAVGTSSGDFHPRMLLPLLNTVRGPVMVRADAAGRVRGLTGGVSVPEPLAPAALYQLLPLPVLLLLLLAFAPLLLVLAKIPGCRSPCSGLRRLQYGVSPLPEHGRNHGG